MLSDRQTGWTLAALGMLAVSTDSLFIRLAEVDAWTMAFMVGVASLPVFVVLWQVEARGRRRRRLPTGDTSDHRNDVPALAVVGVLGAISHVSFIGAVNRTDVANVVAIVAAAPVVAAVVARAVLGERVSRRVWTAIAITSVGVGLVAIPSIGGARLMGDLLAMTAVAAFAVAIVVWRRHPDLSRYLGLAFSSSLVVVTTAPLALPLDVEPRTYFAAGAMGLLFSPAGRVAHSTAPRFAPAAEVALFTPVETVAASLWAWLAFAEAPRVGTVVGAVVIVGGVVYGTVGRVTRARRSRPGRTGRLSPCPPDPG